MSWYELTKGTKFTILSFCLILMFINSVMSPTLENPIWITIYYVVDVIIATIDLYIWFQHRYKDVHDKYKKFKKELERLKKE